MLYGVYLRTGIHGVDIDDIQAYALSGICIKIILNSDTREKLNRKDNTIAFE